MKHVITAAALIALSAGTAFSAEVTGRWATEANDEGGYLEVDIAACGDKVCGTIVAAKNVSGTVNETYEHLGKGIIFDMVADGENKWTDGEIWAPDEDKRYNSNMELNGDVLEVEGCVFFICRGQDWKRVN